MLWSMAPADPSVVAVVAVILWRGLEEHDAYMRALSVLGEHGVGR